MKETLIVISIFIFGFALRSCKTSTLRKLGALTLLIASGLGFYFASGSILIGIMAAAAWFLLPWVELLTRIRKLRMPLKNHLDERHSSPISEFKNALDYARNLENSGFEHVKNCGWNLGGMDQVYQIYWNAETKSVATLCLCEQSLITFAYLSITTRDISNSTWRTTNFPFSPTLKPKPDIHWNQISCVNDCAKKIILEHNNFLHKQGFIDDDLCIPDPDDITKEIENELNSQIQQNIQQGIIRTTDDGHFRYTTRGLFFLWKQFIKDMVRLC